jgi:hypothetical protein
MNCDFNDHVSVCWQNVTVDWVSVEDQISHQALMAAQ